MYAMNYSNFSSSTPGRGKNYSSLDLLIYSFSGKNYSSYNSYASPFQRNYSYFDVVGQPSQRNYSYFDISERGRGTNYAYFSSSQKGVASLLSSSFSLFREGYQLIAVDVSTGNETILGFIEKGSLSLIDFSLADGIYEIYAKYSGLFWDAAQDGKRLSVIISGGVISSSGLPNIRGLRSEISQGIRRIYWNIIPEYNDITGFALWFSATSPVSTTGAPDVEISYFSGQSNYFYGYEQISTEYVAVKSYNNSGYGEASELLLTFSSALSSPSNQYAIKE